MDVSEPKEFYYLFTVNKLM